jgi:hypothetical protein
LGDLKGSWRNRRYAETEIQKGQPGNREGSKPKYQSGSAGKSSRPKREADRRPMGSQTGS